MNKFPYLKYIGVQIHMGLDTIIFRSSNHLFKRFFFDPNIFCLLLFWLVIYLSFSDTFHIWINKLAFRDLYPNLVFINVSHKMNIAEFRLVMEPCSRFDQFILTLFLWHKCLSFISLHWCELFRFSDNSSHRNLNFLIVFSHSIYSRSEDSDQLLIWWTIIRGVKWDFQITIYMGFLCY